MRDGLPHSTIQKRIHSPDSQRSIDGERNKGYMHCWRNVKNNMVDKSFKRRSSRFQFSDAEIEGDIALERSAYRRRFIR